jgi:hypothetical protein
MNLKVALNSGSMWRLAVEQHAWLIVFLLQQSTGCLSGYTTYARCNTQADFLLSFHPPLR